MYIKEPVREGGGAVLVGEKLEGKRTKGGRMCWMHVCVIQSVDRSVDRIDRVERTLNQKTPAANFKWNPKQEKQSQIKSIRPVSNAPMSFYVRVSRPAATANHHHLIHHHRGSTPTGSQIHTQTDPIQAVRSSHQSIGAWGKPTEALPESAVAHFRPGKAGSSDRLGSRDEEPVRTLSPKTSSD